MARLDLATNPYREVRKRRRMWNCKNEITEPKRHWVKQPVGDHIDEGVESSTSVNDLPCHLEEPIPGEEVVNKEGNSDMLKSSADEELSGAYDGDYISIQPISDTPALIEDKDMTTRSQVDNGGLADVTPAVTDRKPPVTDRKPPVTDRKSRAKRHKKEREYVSPTTSTYTTSTTSKRSGV